MKAISQPLVSIVVPIYNVELYLSRCIESVLKQDYSHFELILVDDGSTDGSAGIIDDYASRYNNVYAYHKRNGGVSSARNVGIKASKGDFLYFIDSDDEIFSFTIRVLVEGIFKSPNVDVVKGLSVRNTDVTKSDNAVISNTISSKKAITKALFKDLGGVCDTLFRKSIIDDSIILFHEDLYSGEDFLFYMEYLCHSRGDVCYLNTPVYIIHSRNDGISASFFRDTFSQKSLSVFKSFLLISKIVNSSDVDWITKLQSKMVLIYHRDRLLQVLNDSQIEKEDKTQFLFMIKQLSKEELSSFDVMAYKVVSFLKSLKRLF